MLSGKLEEVIYATLEPGEDLLRGLWDICRQNDVKTGVLLDATGAMDKVRVMKISKEPRTDNHGCDYIEIPGPLEVSAHGIIGVGWVPDKSVTPPPSLIRSRHDTGFGAAGFEGHEAPYFHVHITVTNIYETVCGHLLEGSPVCHRYPGQHYRRQPGEESVGYFTVAIAKVSGVILRATWDQSGYYHELVKA